MQIASKYINSIGSKNNLELRIKQHKAGEGANHTKKHLPVELVYYEEYKRNEEVFNREKQAQDWSRKKKEALINAQNEKLLKLTLAYRDLKNLDNRLDNRGVASRTSATVRTLRLSKSQF